jgi:4-hydroxy-3-polyprenylbenzoate decarboxylase
MAKDLRDFLAAVDDVGELKTFEGAHWEHEIGAITELVAEKGSGRGGPACLFDDIEGYPSGFRVLSNTFGSVERSRIVLDKPEGTTALEMVDQWRKDMKAEPWSDEDGTGDGTVLLSDPTSEEAPLIENVDTGDDVDVTKFPVPVWHEQDEDNRYIGTGCTILTKDPDTGWVNLGVYRSSIIDEQTVTMGIWPGKDGLVTMRKYHERGENCPIAMLVGMDPWTWLASTITLHRQESEYEVAGWLQDEPIPVIEGPETGLPLPANAEIALEGYLPPLSEERCTDGPFGEWPGYSTPPHPDLPVMHVTNVMHRDDPIILGQPPLRPPALYTLGVPVRTAGGVWNQLEDGGVPSVKGVWSHVIERPMFLVIAIEQEYAGHAKQAALGAISTPNGAYGGRYVVVVDDDVDVTNLDEVLWAMVTRCRAEDVEIVEGVYTSPLDPMVEDRQRPTSGRVIVDATRPYDEEFPEAIAFPDDYREEVREKWGIDDIGI